MTRQHSTGQATQTDKPTIICNVSCFKEVDNRRTLNKIIYKDTLVEIDDHWAFSSEDVKTNYIAKEKNTDLDDINV